jgi:monovalent cation/proton antiporter, MnhG/PhaG subunit
LKESAELLSALLILAGTGFCFLSAVGILRFPDVYNRSHAASKSSTLGVLCILVGTFLYFLLAEGYFSIRLLLGIFFVFLTAPVSAHLLCRSAYRSGIPLCEATVRDELQSYLQEQRAGGKRNEK